MIIDVQDRVDNLIHKVEGFLKDIKQEKESLDREVLLEERPFKVNEYTEGDIEWEDFDVILFFSVRGNPSLYIQTFF